MADFVPTVTLKGLIGTTGVPNAGEEDGIALEDGSGVLVSPRGPNKASDTGRLCFCFLGLSLIGLRGSVVILPVC